EGVTGAPDLGPLRRRVKKVLKDAQDGTNTHPRDDTPTDTHAALTSPGGQQSIETYMQQPPHSDHSPNNTNNTNNTHGEESSHSPAVGQGEADRVPQIISKTTPIQYPLCCESVAMAMGPEWSVCALAIIPQSYTKALKHLHL
ncbi:hypothetical protein SARC_13629, partial [Sphaeroforma arctica JP610]